VTDRDQHAESLFRGALAEGEISEDSNRALLRINGIGSQVGPALARDVSDTEVLLVSVLVDDTASIETRAPAVIRGHNRMIEASMRTGRAAVLFHTRLVKHGVLAPYTPVTRATHLSAENYRATGVNTPLYEQSVITLGTVMAQTRELAAANTRVRTFTLLLTDGANNVGSSTAADVRYLATDMLEFATSRHIVAGMGIGSPDFFRPIFRDMGIPDGWILTAASTDKEVDDLFREKIEPSLKLAASSEAAYKQIESGPPPS
jgi:hypothetical protein